MPEVESFKNIPFGEAIQKKRQVLQKIEMEAQVQRLEIRLMELEEEKQNCFSSIEKAKQKLAELK